MSRLHRDVGDWEEMGRLPRKLLNTGEDCVGFSYPEDAPGVDDQPKFSTNSVLIMLKVLTLSDTKEIAIIGAKATCPDASFQEIGKLVGMSKQGVDKRISAITKKFPFLADLLRNREEASGKRRTLDGRRRAENKPRPPREGGRPRRGTGNRQKLPM